MDWSKSDAIEVTTPESRKKRAHAEHQVQIRRGRRGTLYGCKEYNTLHSPPHIPPTSFHTPASDFILAHLGPVRGGQTGDFGTLRGGSWVDERVGGEGEDVRLELRGV